MRFYQLSWENIGNPVPKILNWTEKMDYHAVVHKEIWKLPERTLLYIEPNTDTIFPDIINSPFLLVSDKMWEVMKKYRVHAEGKEVVLLDTINGHIGIYYMPHLKEYDCLSDKTVFNNDGSVIQKVVLDSRKLDKLPPVFRIAGVAKDYVIGRMDFVESILRRDAVGLKISETEVE